MYLWMTTFKGWKVLDVNVGVGRSNGGHVDSVQDDGNDVVGENLPELLSYVVQAKGILKGKVELEYIFVQDDNVHYYCDLVRGVDHLQTVATLLRRTS